MDWYALTGFSHAQYIGAEARTDQCFEFVVIRENSVITVLQDEDGNSQLAAVRISGITLLANDVIKCPNGKRIRNITLSSGSAFGMVTNTLPSYAITA